MISRRGKSAPWAAAALVLLWIGAGGRAPGAAEHPTAEQQEVTNFRLSTDKLTKYEAAMKAYDKLVAADPSLKKKMDAESGANDRNTVAGSVAVIEKHPEVASAIRGAGLSTREYVVMSYALINTNMAVAMKKKG